MRVIMINRYAWTTDATLGCPSGRPFSAWSLPTWSTTMHDVHTPEFKVNEIRRTATAPTPILDKTFSQGKPGEYNLLMAATLCAGHVYITF